MEINMGMISILTALLAAGASYGGVKVGLNGLRQKMRDQEVLCGKLDERADQHADRITKLEVQVDYLKEQRP